MATDDPRSSPAYWMARQLLLPDPQRRLHVIAGVRGREQFSIRMALADLERHWPWVQTALSSCNLSPHSPAGAFVYPFTTSASADIDAAHFVFALLRHDAAGRHASRYTRDDRLRQLHFWHRQGIYPSWIVDYGDGLVAFWKLDTPVSREDLTQLLSALNRAVGSYRVTTLLRPNAWACPLPGFLFHTLLSSTKLRSCRYAKSNSAPGMARLLHPVNYLNHAAVSYPASLFSSFPLSDLESLDAADRALAVDAQAAHSAITASAERLRQRSALQLVPALSASAEYQRQIVEAKARLAVDRANFAPSIAVMPLASDLPFPWGRRRTIAYIQKGMALANEHLVHVVQAILGKALHVEQVSKLELDERIIAEFVRWGYTEDAVVEFWFRPAHACQQGTTAEMVRGWYRTALARLRAVPQTQARASGLLEILHVSWWLSTEDHAVWRATCARVKRAPLLVRGSVLALNPIPCYEAYSTYYRSCGREPVPYQVLEVEARLCRERYWLGVDTDSHQSWQFSLPELRRLGLCKEKLSQPLDNGAGRGKV